jgi:hypothetical protein
LVCAVSSPAPDTYGGGFEMHSKQAQLIDVIYQDAEERNVEPEQVFSELGYECRWSALQTVVKRIREPNLLKLFVTKL